MSRQGPTKMHPDEVEVHEHLVGQLVAAQFPRWRDLAIRAVASTGTVNAMFRLGDDMGIRLPRHQRWVADLEKELRWLGPLRARLPLRVPELLAVGVPGGGYPFPWAVSRWLDGEIYDVARVDDETQAAVDLAHFVSELRRIDISGAPPSGRLPLRQLAEATSWTIGAIGDRIDGGAVTEIWEQSLRGPAWDGAPVWRHCDLLPPNLLVRDGRLAAVIDCGDMAAGDAACDLGSIWMLLPDREARRRAMAAYGASDATWTRARGWAALMIVMLLSISDNPRMPAMGRRMMSWLAAGP